MLRCSWTVMGDLAWSPSSESGRGHGCGPWALGSALGVLAGQLSAG